MPVVFIVIIVVYNKKKEEIAMPSFNASDVYRHGTPLYREHKGNGKIAADSFTIPTNDTRTGPKDRRKVHTFVFNERRSGLCDRRGGKS